MAGKQNASDEAWYTKWLNERLFRTILPSYKLVFPRSWTNPLTYLGLLSFSCFVVLGASGIALMFYYSPDFVNSYDSITKIMEEIPFGFEMRNIHYYASDFMVLLAIAHFFYLFFVGKYRYKNEVLWLTGMVFGVLAVIEAYTGYILIMNTRAMLAVNIGSGLLNSISPGLSSLLIGGSYSDLVLRVYTLHVIALPAIMVLLTLVHFPRILTIDVPAVAIVSGIILVIGGLLPVELGQKFVPNAASSITVPEWYLTGLYSFLRTGAPVFIAGVFLPFLLIFIFSLIPFYDKGGNAKSGKRFLVVALGAAVLSQVVLVTVWGFRGSNILAPIYSEEELIIDPMTFWSAFLLTGAAAVLATRMVYGRKWATRPSTDGATNRVSSSLGSLVRLAILLAAQALLLIHATILKTTFESGAAMVEVGLVVVLFGISMRIFLRSGARPHSNEGSGADTGGAEN